MVGKANHFANIAVQQSGDFSESLNTFGGIFMENNIEISPKDAPIEAYQKIHHEETEKNFGNEMMDTQFDSFIERYNQLKLQEVGMKEEFKEKLKKNTKYLLYKDKRRIWRYEDAITFISSIALILLIALITLFNLLVWQFFL